MTYTFKNIASILSAKALLSNTDASIEYLVTDSRRISFPSTSLFFALQTSRRDGHAFVKEVYERGVRNFIVKNEFDTTHFSDANFILVDDTLKALQQLAA